MSKGKAERDLENFEKVFGALAHATRRHILVVLNARGREMTAGEIAARFHCSWPTTSRHLKILVNAGLITVRRQGKQWVYVLENAFLSQVVEGWLQWFTKKEFESFKKSAPRGPSETGRKSR